MSRPKSIGSTHNESSARLPINVAHRPMNSVGSRRATSVTITAKQLEEIQHRHQLQMTLIKQEARELKEDKAYLVAKNLRLERELSRQNQSFVHGVGGVLEQRRTNLNSRPSFNRSRSQPNADLHDPHHPLCITSPTCSGSSCSSHPWISSGGTNTPSSQSPRSRHSRNTSSVSLAVTSSHAPPTLSRRPSLSSTGPPTTSAPDPAVLLHRLRLASRQQKLPHYQHTLNPLRPLSVAPSICDESRLHLSRSNPGSRPVSRRNSLSAGSGHDHLPLKGILKPSAPIRPVSSCSNTVVGPPTRPSTGMGYYFDEAYDSITHTNGQRGASSAFNQQIYQSHPPHQRSRRASLEAINGAGERMKYK